MRVHFTNLFGQSPRSVALIAQNDTMKIAKELGANELAIYFYDNSQESSGELNSRLDGIVAGVSYGDIVFFQSPSWNSVAWDTSLIHKFRAVQTKLVMFIHDVPPIMFPSNYFIMPNYIEMYNLCDVVVVPSEQMRDRLIEEGLTVKKIIIQELWDLPHNLDLHNQASKRSSSLLVIQLVSPTFSTGSRRHLFMSMRKKKKTRIIPEFNLKAGVINRSSCLTFLKEVLVLSGGIQKNLKMSLITIS